MYPSYVRLVFVVMAATALSRSFDNVIRSPAPRAVPTDASTRSASRVIARCISTRAAACWAMISCSVTELLSSAGVVVFVVSIMFSWLDPNAVLPAMLSNVRGLRLGAIASRLRRRLHPVAATRAREIDLTSDRFTAPRQLDGATGVPPGGCGDGLDDLARRRRRTASSAGAD